jgi:hypothetical protein
MHDLRGASAAARLMVADGDQQSVNRIGARLVTGVHRRGRIGAVAVQGRTAPAQPAASATSPASSSR